MHLLQLPTNSLFLATGKGPISYRMRGVKIAPKEELQKENDSLRSEIQTLQQRIQELETKSTSGRQSKSREMAEKTLALLKAGPVTVEQPKQINERYPTDCIHYCRTLLKAVILRQNISGQTYYFLPEFTSPASSAREKSRKQNSHDRRGSSAIDSL